MNTFIFIKEDNTEIRILQGQSIEELKNKHLELQRNFHSYTWEQFCANVNMNNAKNVDPNLNFTGRDIKIYYVEGVVNGILERGYQYYINGERTKLMSHLQSNFTNDLKWMFVYIANILNGSAE